MAAPKGRVEDERYCHYCFERLVQRPDESPSNYLSRRTCNKVCAGKLSVPSKKKHQIRDASKLGVTFGSGFKNRRQA